MERPLVGTEEFQVFRSPLAAPSPRSQHRKTCPRSRMPILLPLPTFGTWPARGCPQPQHVREGSGFGTLGPHREVGAAAAEDSRAPGVVSSCALATHSGQNPVA